MPAANLRRPWRHAIWSCLALALVLFLVSPVAAQSSTESLSTSTSLSLTTTTTTLTTTTRSGNRDFTTTLVSTSVFNVTHTSVFPVTPTETETPPDPAHLDTKIDPAFGVLGALLILTGLPSAFLGHKNRWTSFFLVGFYTLSLVCLVLILKFGVVDAVNLPNKTLRGLFVLSCGIAGVAGGGISIFFWKASKYFIGAWGGFVVALWVQCLRNGGLITPIGFRWIMYIAVAVVGFILCTIPKFHYYILLMSTAFVGATAFMLGVDCYTTAGLKEFYIWNIGYESIFQRYLENDIKFPVTQIMQIELGMIGAVSLMGIAVQFQILKVLQRKLKEIEAERKRETQEAEERAAARFMEVEGEKIEWEAEHPPMFKHGRMDSGLSGTPLLKGYSEGSPTPDEHGSTAVGTPRQRYQSGVSDFMAAPTPEEELNRSAAKQLQSPGALPVLDLGGDIESNVPKVFVAESSRTQSSKALTSEELEDIKRKEELLSEIQTIRRSIDFLRSDTPGRPSAEEARRQSSSLTSRRTPSQDVAQLSAGQPSHLRPPRERDPRARVQSMELSELARNADGSSIGRSSSVPLRDEDWDLYLHERKLFQPPSGVSAPIPTTPPARMAISPAVADALADRQRRESALGLAAPSSPERIAHAKSPSSDDVPLATRPTHKRAGSSVPVTILPPQRPIAQPKPQSPETSPRVKTFEELVDRHREKLHELQAPITLAEKEQADITEAKSRWEHAKDVEKKAVARRQAEQLAATRQKASGKERRSPSDDPKRHTRSLSADMLANVPGMQGSSKRMSTMKVEDWQRSQQEAAPSRPSGGSRPQHQGSRRPSGVPFPDSTRDSRRRSSAPLS